MRFSANTGFLWPDLPFLDRIRAAARAGFDAVEFHDEAQNTDADALRAVLRETGLPVCGLNVRMGSTAGVAAIPGAQAQARADIDAAIRTADLVDAGAIHLLSGNTDAADAAQTLIENLRYALHQTRRTILIEPICRAANPSYFLHDLDQAMGILTRIDHPRLKLMFDCFHIETQHGDCAARFLEVAAHVGHVQIAGVPGRLEPTSGAVDYRHLLPALRAAGYTGAFGAEYRPSRDADGQPSVDMTWLGELRAL